MTWDGKKDQRFAQIGISWMHCHGKSGANGWWHGMAWSNHQIVFSSETSSHSHPFFRGIWQDSVHELCRLQARNLGDLRSAGSPSLATFLPWSLESLHFVAVNGSSLTHKTNLTERQSKHVWPNAISTTVIHCICRNWQRFGSSEDSLAGRAGEAMWLCEVTRRPGHDCLGSWENCGTVHLSALCWTQRMRYRTFSGNGCLVGFALLQLKVLIALVLEQTDKHL